MILLLSINNYHSTYFFTLPFSSTLCAKNGCPIVLIVTHYPLVSISLSMGSGIRNSRR